MGILQKGGLMKISFEHVGVPDPSGTPTIGDVYQAKGGRNGTFVWVVVSLRNSVAHLLGINQEGAVVSTASYAEHSLVARQRIGKCESVASLNLTVALDLDR